MNVLMESKNELNQFLQKHCKRPLTKSDIEYKTSKYGMQYQAIVTLHCMNKQEYAGHLCSDQKAAEKSAAQQALLANSEMVEALKREQPKRAGMMTAEERAAKRARTVDPAENPAITPKTELNTLCMRIVGRFMKKGETVYICNKINSQYQATVQIHCLPNEWGQRAWAGHLCVNKQKAEQSAAEIALKDIKDDPTLQELAASSKGKGKGKGNYWSGMQAMWEMMSSWWWSDAREQIIEEHIEGEMVEWKGHYGWMKTDHPIEHDAKTMRGGKIYINKKDIEGNPETVAEGQKVKFKLYVDSSGLGAEAASLV